MGITTGTLIQKSSKTRGPRFPMRSATSEKVKSQLGTTKVTRTVITTKTAAVVETKMAAKTTKMAAALAALVVVVTKTAANTTNTAAEAVAEVVASLPTRVDPISGSTCNTKVSFHRNPSKVPRTGWIPGAQLRCSKSSTKITTTKSACVNTRTRCTAPRCSRSA